jgi:hypothetical protein
MFLLYSFCIIEGPETIEDFVQMQSHEIQDNIKSRRNKIFLLMEEVSVLGIMHISWSMFLVVHMVRLISSIYVWKMLSGQTIASAAANPNF